MIEAVLPEGVIGVDASGDADTDAVLWPEEEAALGPVRAVRRREFVAGRACAHRALRRLGPAPGPVTIAPGGAPLWPPGVTGSITHCDQYRAAAVAATHRFEAIGIDAEPHAPLPPDMLSLIARPEERYWLRNERPGPHWDRVLFSAKESFYKAWFPITGRWLEFRDVLVTMNEPERFRIALAVDAPAEHRRAVDRMRGRFAIVDGLVLCFCGAEADPTLGSG